MVAFVFVYIDTKYYGERHVVESSAVYTLALAYKLLDASVLKCVTLFPFWANRLA